MDLRHLRYFAVLAEELHFARAAGRLGIEQSPLSRQIQDLEADLGVRLFYRTSRSTTLTRAGELLRVHARRILDDVEISVSDVRAFAQLKTPLRLGLAEGAVGASFERFIRLCRTADPVLSIIPLERSASMLVDLLVRGGVDAIVTREPVELPELQSDRVWADRLVVVASSNRGLPRSVALQSLAEDRLILPDPELARGLAVQITSILQRHQLTPPDPILAGSAQTVLQLAASGMGLGLLPESATQQSAAVCVRALEDVDAWIGTWMCIRASDPPPVAELAMSLAKRAADPQCGM